MKLRCIDPECESHEEGQYMFTVNATFDEDRELAENIRKVEASYFTCCICGDKAKDVENEDL